MASNLEITNRLGLPDSVRMVFMTVAYVIIKVHETEVISHAPEIAHMMFLVARFLGVVGWSR
jgi:hypothetical protein